MSRKKLGDVVKNERGFEVIDFRDLYGAQCSLQQSSLAEYVQPGISAVWLGCDNNQPPHHVTGDEMSPRMHLNRDQVTALIRHLRSWLKSGSFAADT